MGVTDKLDETELTNLKAAGDGARNEDVEIIVPPPGRWTSTLIFAVISAAFGSSFQFGYNIGVVNNPKEPVSRWINASNFELTGEGLDFKQLNVTYSMVVAIFAIGGMIGGLISGIVAEKFGRKGGMLVNNILVFIAAALMGFSKTSNVHHLLTVGRFVIGINCGLNTGLAPMYLTEISPINLRGTLGSVHQLMCVIGILVSNILGLPQLLGTDEHWPFLFALIIVPAIYQIITLPFCPESPKHLLILKHQMERAESALIKLRKTNDVKAEIDEMELEYNKMKKAPAVKFTDMFRDDILRWALILAVMMMFAQQFSGINVAMYYSSAIFEKAGLKGDQPKFATLGVGVVNVIMTLVSTVLVDRMGRRTLMLAGLSGMWIVSVLLVILLTLLSQGYTWTSYVCVVAVFLFVVAFATGPGSIPWFYVSELFLQGARSNANAVAVVTNWLANFIVGLVFLPLNDAVGQFSFLLFTFCLTIFIVFTYIFVPETKGRTVEEVVLGFKKGKLVRNQK